MVACDYPLLPRALTRPCAHTLPRFSLNGLAEARRKALNLILFLSASDGWEEKWFTADGHREQQVVWRERSTG